MKKITVAVMATLVLASGAMAGEEGFKICKYSDNEYNPMDTHISIVIRSIVDNNLVPQFGNLEGVPLNVSSQKGATTLKLSWESFLSKLNNKIVNSANPAAEITYLNLPLANYQPNVTTAEEASTEMIKDLLKSNKILGFTIDLNNDNCNSHGNGHGIESPWVLQRMISGSSILKGVGVNNYIIYLKNYLEKDVNTFAEISKFNAKKGKK